MHENETVKKEDLLEIANWIMKVAEQSSFAHDELKALHYADTVRGAADQAETLRCAVGELDQCHWNLKRCSKMLRERNAQIEAFQLQIPKHGEWVWIHRHHGGFKTAKGKCECGRDVYAQIDERYETDDPYCPFCGVMNDSIHLNYCPNCGADMRAKMEVRDGAK